jgi:uncharacterized 2Fe-2S/4Fe-4S cluster protein (DUF4445 family)
MLPTWIFRSSRRSILSTLALIHRAGLTEGDIGRVYLAGGFGNYMDGESAIAIGLLSEKFRHILKNIGNAAGAGAGMALVKSEYITEYRRIADVAQHVELSTDAYFMEKYVDCMMFLGGLGCRKPLRFSGCWPYVARCFFLSA